MLSRSKFDRYVPLSERILFARFLINRSTIIDVSSDFEVCRDPRDDMFLQLAIDGNASCIITGDPDLLVLHPFRNISIIQPATFLQTY